MALFREPLPFIVTDANGGLVLVEETATKLATISRNLVVVAIAGRYRTGKSFLLNRLAGSQHGFALGHTVQSKTKGLWIWPIPHPHDDSKYLVLLDTEGLGDVEKGSTQHDTWIFVLAMLLSSMLVFNTLSCIDRSSLQELSFVSDMSKHVRTKMASHDGVLRECEMYFPYFVICVRDFTLALEVNDKSCTPDQYMEHCFHPRSASTTMSKEAREYRHQLETLCSIFTKRKCFVFPLPTEPEKMKILESLDDSSLKPQFVRNMNEFASFVVESAEVKNIETSTVNGTVLVHLARKYVKAQQEGAIPCMESTFKMVVEDVNSRVCKEAFDIYQGLICEEVNMPTSVSHIKAIHLHCWRIAIQSYKYNCVLDHENKHGKILNEKVEKFFTSYLKKNENTSLEACRRCLDMLYEPIRASVEDEAFLQPGGFQYYQHEMKKLRINYDESGNMGEMAEEAFADFLEKRRSESHHIRIMDSTLSKMDKDRLEREERMKEMESRHVAQQNAIQNQQKELEALREQMQTSLESYEEKVMEMHSQMNRPPQPKSSCSIS
uniref:guanylate-binding protein 1-like n=1 Tax=Myxine glutinosa TaxID=7769 RepID=UPI00358FB40E